jgi:hypothetical protein
MDFGKIRMLFLMVNLAIAALLCALAPKLSSAVEISTRPAGYRSPGYWTLPAVAKSLPGREVIRLMPEPGARTQELSDWLASTGAKSLEGRDIPRPAWVVRRDRVGALKREIGRFGVRLDMLFGAGRCDAKEAVRASTDLKALTDEFGYIEDYKTRLDSVLFLASAYATALREIAQACAMGEETLLYLETDNGNEGPSWHIPSELTRAGSAVMFTQDQIRVPPISGTPPEDYLGWGELLPLYLCSGKATLLTVSGIRDESVLRARPAELIKPYDDRPIVSYCAEPSTITPEAGEGGGRGSRSSPAGFRVLEDSLPAIKERLSAMGKVTAEERLVEAQYNPLRREAHLWYASLKSELEEAGDLLRDTPHIQALVRDEVGRLPGYFATSDDPEGRRLLYMVIER